MRILLTTDTVGGVWTFTQELAKGLLALGHDVALVSFGRMPNASQSIWCAQMSDAHGGSFTYNPSDIPLEWMQQNESLYADGVAMLKGIVSRFSPDLLHSNQFCWGALDSSIPRLITAHSDVMSWFAAVKPDVPADSPWLERYRSLVQCGLDRADAVVTPTMWMQAALQEHFEITCRTQVIYNGRTIATQDLPTSRRKLQAVTTGRLWDEAKGLSTLSAITSAMPVILAGEDSFESRSTTIPLQMRVAGLLEERDLLTLFHQSSVYLATSVYEPFGLAPLEAALCGCAVIARDIPSLREVWADGALYFHEARELEATLHHLSTDGALLSRIQLASSSRAKRYSARQMTLAYLALYESLVADGTAVGAQEELVADAL